MRNTGEEVSPVAKIIISDDGRKIVEIQTIKFSGKRRIDWDGVEQYLKQYIGKHYKIDETDNIVYIGSDFPDEYTHSNYKKTAFGTIGKAKANISQAIPELIKTAENMCFRQNYKSKNENKAMNGWYYGTIYFTLPTTNDKGTITGHNRFRGRMVIRCDVDDKLYLYDIIDIKKET